MMATATDDDDDHHHHNNSNNNNNINSFVQIGEMLALISIRHVLI